MCFDENRSTVVILMKVTAAPFSIKDYCCYHKHSLPGYWKSLYYQAELCVNKSHFVHRK